MKRIWVVLVALAALCSPAAARQSDIAPDGTVYVTGDFVELPFRPLSPHSCPQHVEGLLHTRLDGTRIDSFGLGGFVAGDWEHVVALRDGGVAAIGPGVTRLDSAGRRTSTAAPNLGFGVEDAHELPDGRLVVSGLSRIGEDGAFRLAVAVVRADGTPDPGFGHDGIALSQGTFANPSSGGRPYPIPLGCLLFGNFGGAPASVLDDGRILVGGPELAARFTPSGGPDASWGGDGEVTVGDHQGIVAAAGDAAFVLELRDDRHVRVQRLRADGSPDVAWGESGAMTVALAEVARAVKDARVIGDGRLAFLATARPYIVAADGSSVSSGPQAPSSYYSDLFRLGDELATIGPEGEHLTLTRYPPGLASSSSTPLDIVSTAPRLTIASGPPQQRGAVTGSSARFRIELESRPEDLGLAGVLCESGVPFPIAIWECGRDTVVGTAEEGPVSLVVRPVSIHGAVGPPTTYSWGVNHGAPKTLIRSRPSALTAHRTARISWTASEPVTTTCAVDGRTRPCTSPLRLRGLRPGRHRVRLTATDEQGAGEVRPATIGWRVGPRLTLHRRGRTVAAALTAPIRGTARLHATLLRSRHVVRRHTIRLTLRGGRTRVVRFTVPPGLRLRVAARMPGAPQPLVRTLPR